ncbi:hypothetical protein ADK34_07810 [Streptomyces viridochromogenes]|uniref:Uncharacterized protein n=1 Tax=Streptomyces viridochromogenes TaxID=1938 RepID=A0A0L8L6M3_STRVR|nr:hypothetical protein ADK34_07810 [Streptomyces viridochromogenes]
MLYRVSRRKASSLASRSLDQALGPLSVSLSKATVKDSAAALSALDPIAPMLCRTPADLQSSAKALLEYGEPWSVCMIAPARLPRVCSAAVRASMTSSVRMRSAMAQPAGRPARGEVDDGREVERLRPADRQVGDIAATQSHSASVPSSRT